MRHHIFTIEERKELESNPNISKVCNSNVEYTDKFKERVFNERKEFGKSAKQIFEEAGIPDWLNRGKYAQRTLRRWVYQQRHPKTNKRGRPAIDINKPINEMSLEELRQRVAYLELENEFLKKLEPLEQYKEKN